MPYLNDEIGYRRVDTSLASAESAQTIARPLREKVLVVVRSSREPISTYEIADILDAPYASVQPRLTELQTAGRVVDSGKRGKTPFGKACVLWAATRTAEVTPTAAR